MNHCYDLKFNKPNFSDILRRIKVIQAEEDLDIDATALEKMVELSQFDIR